MARVTAYAIQSDGTRSYGLTVRGIRVLVTADEDRSAEGLALAEAIAELGPENAPVGEPAAEPEKEEQRASTREFRAGERVYCTVHGSEGECTVVEVGAGRNRGRIKIRGYRPWCPAHNFRPLEAK